MVCFWYNLIDLHMSGQARLLLKFRFHVEFFDFREQENCKKNIYSKIFSKS
jgi:hypothetical protein